jgi:hypothetical protein
MGVFAGAVNVKAVVSMFDHRNTQTAHFEHGNQLFHQCGFAGSGVSGESNHIHATTFNGLRKLSIKELLAPALIGLDADLMHILSNV